MCNQNGLWIGKGEKDFIKIAYNVEVMGASPGHKGLFRNVH